MSLAFNLCQTEVMYVCDGQGGGYVMPVYCLSNEPYWLCRNYHVVSSILLGAVVYKVRRPLYGTIVRLGREFPYTPPSFVGFGIYGTVGTNNWFSINGGRFASGRQSIGPCQGTWGPLLCAASTRPLEWENYQGFSRVMTRPAGRVKGVSKSRGSDRVGSLRFKISRVGSGRFKRFPKSRGSGRVGSGQEASKSRGSGRVGSRGFKISRVGSVRVKRFSKSRGSGRVMTR